MKKGKFIAILLVLAVIYPIRLIVAESMKEERQSGTEIETGWYSRFAGDGAEALNGFYWEQLDTFGKLAYVMAFEEGAFACSSYLTNFPDAKIGKEDLKRLSEKLNGLMNTNVTAPEQILYINFFYIEQPGNKHIPISVVRAALWHEYRGEKESADELIQEMKGNWKQVNDTEVEPSNVSERSN